MLDMHLKTLRIRHQPVRRKRGSIPLEPTGNVILTLKGWYYLTSGMVQ